MRNRNTAAGLLILILLVAFSACGTRNGKDLDPVLQRLVDNMVRVEGGTFNMGGTPEQGSDAWDREKPVHEVTLPDYYIGKYEVSQEEWLAVMGEPNPSAFKDPKLPAERTSWDACQEFIEKLNALTGRKFRLPTEAEWEFAARGGNQSQGYKYAGSNTLEEVAWYLDNSEGSTHERGTKRPNELGIYDMSGNVWEWCSDYYGEYNAQPQVNPQGNVPGTSNHVLRGGSWGSEALGCRVSFRFSNTSPNRDYVVGFRLVCDL